jgi:hypothetical protein
METIPFHEFSTPEIDAFRILCNHYGHAADAFAVQAVVPKRSPSNVYQQRKVTLLHRETGIWRVYPAGTDDTWLIDFERDLSNIAFVPEKSGRH